MRSHVRDIVILRSCGFEIYLFGFSVCVYICMYVDQMRFIPQRRPPCSSCISIAVLGSC